MIITDKTHDRIIQAIENGARLVLYKSVCSEFGTVVEKITLRKGDNELRLDHAHRFDEVKYLWKRESVEWMHHDIPSGECLAYHIMAMDSIRTCYAGYRGDFQRRYQEIFEHRNQPVPRWVSEQWETPVSRYGVEWS